MSCNPIYPDEPIQLIGVVFCGGKSTRMGEDKGLKTKDGVSWADIAARKFENLGLPYCLSINPHQKESYSLHFAEERLVTDKFGIEGPLEGLLSVHNAFPHHDLLILACDLVDIQEQLIQRLVVELRQREGEHDFFVYQRRDMWEPLLGIYTREGLQKLFDLFALGNLEKYSMKHALEIGNTYSIALSTEEEDQFTNYNTPADISGK